MAIDASAVFIDELKARANQLGLAHLIMPIQADMAKLDWPAGSVDLLWAESAAYNLGFEQALKTRRSGFIVLSTHRLPSQAWWVNYYEPRRQRMQQIEITPTIQSVIRATEAEMKLFENFSDAYGYTFYLLQTA